MKVFLIVLALAVVVTVQYVLSVEFFDVALLKGYKEKKYFKQYNNNVYRLVCKAGDNGKGDNAQNIVNNSGGENSCAYAVFKLAHLV